MIRKVLSSSVYQLALSNRGALKAFNVRSNFFNAERQRMFVGASMVYLSHYLFNKTTSLNEFYELDLKADLKDGEMREVQVGPKKEDAVVIARVDGKYYCLSNKCTHYGAPLAQGTLVGDKLKCPWHNASFSVKDGAFEEGPMFNGLQTFPVEVKGDQLKIKIQKDLLNAPRVLNMVTKGDDPTNYVIVGGGPAGISAAETLRQSGFRGSITIITAEDVLPYDRTGMSKGLYFTPPTGATFRKKEFFEKYGIDVKTGTVVEGVDYTKQELTLKGGAKLPYNKLLLATGGTARRPPVPGIDLKNVFTLRNVNDALRLKEPTKNAKNIVVIGASFIGLETAGTIKNELKDKVNITVVDSNKVAFEKSLGKEIGQSLQSLHEKNGIKFVFSTQLKEIQGTDEVKKVVLQNGQVLDADVVIVGAGITPNVELAKNLKISKTNGGIETDVFLKTSKNNVFSAGDVTSYPYWANGESVRVEHHNEAIYQGYIAGLNMAGTPTPLANVPFFWTRHWDKALQYSGVGHGFDEVFVDGDLNNYQYVAYYGKNGKVIASASMNVPNAQMIISEALRLNIMPTVADLRSKKANLETIKSLVNNQQSKCNCQRAKNCKNSL